MKQTPEFKKLMGQRQADSDGFTYPYGRFNFNGAIKSLSVDRQRRNDKRSVKAKTWKRIKNEEGL